MPLMLLPSPKGLWLADPDTVSKLGELRRRPPVYCSAAGKIGSVRSGDKGAVAEDLCHVSLIGD